LWEEKYGTSTYTAASVYAGLMAAGKFATVLGKDDDARVYQAIAQRIQSAIGTILYDEARGVFVKHVLHGEGDALTIDPIVDSSSVFGVIRFGVFDITDERVVRALVATRAALHVPNASQGYVRYEGDQYYRMREASSPNPWVITTLWMAQCDIAAAKQLSDLKSAFELLEWTASHATTSGVLAEQMHPDTRAHLSTAPLVWSHAEFVIAIQAYLKKAQELSM
jgi:GH15 family glucan-1,4-alpha-glucosidase